MILTKHRASLLFVVAALLPAAAQADDSTQPPSPFSLSASVQALSQYRFRGISRSDGQPAVQADVAILNRWAERGLCRPLDGRHLMVLLWASTQVYADWASQISLVLGKPALEAQDFADAESMIVDMVLRTVLVPATR